jgi:hypothetical protein
MFVGSMNAVFWDIFKAVTMKDVVFLDKTPCGYSKRNRRFGGSIPFRREVHPRS